MSGTPLAEVEIDEVLVRTLLRDQHDDLAELSLQLMDASWDNVMFRLGDSYVVRMPRRSLAVPLLLNEQTWLPKLAAQLPLPIPSPLRLGRPGHSYPWCWSILPWLPGSPADECPPHDDEAHVFGTFLLALHHPAPRNAPANAFRGCPLEERSESLRLRVEQLKGAKVDLPSGVVIAWNEGLAAPVSENPRWLHGDLHARNVLVDNGRISAIIDWGDITSGDVATDLAGVWSLFDNADARRIALQAYGANVDQIARARAWAVNFGVLLLATGLVDHPRYAVMGADILRRVNDDLSIEL